MTNPPDGRVPLSSKACRNAQSASSSPYASTVISSISSSRSASFLSSRPARLIGFLPLRSAAHPASPMTGRVAAYEQRHEQPPSSCSSISRVVVPGRSAERQASSSPPPSSSPWCRAPPRSRRAARPARHPAAPSNDVSQGSRHRHRPSRYPSRTGSSGPAPPTSHDGLASITARCA
jgi:hypothetical protein